MTFATPVIFSRNRWLCPLEQVDSAGKFGQKAYNLARVARLGLAVPPGCVLTCDAFHEFLGHDGLGEAIEVIACQVDLAKPASFQVAAKSILARVLAAPLPSQVIESLIPFGENLLGRTWVVRSSAVGEDSEGAAFPGMLDSLLHQTTSEGLGIAIRRCWASYWSDRCLFYRASRNLSLAGMGVILQEQVAATVSGVLFTRHPERASGNEGVMLAEYCQGLADALVQGQVVPERIVLPRAPRQIDPSPLDGRIVLSVKQVESLRTAGELLEREFQYPQDIEWSIDERGVLYLLQSRPITVFQSVAQSASRPDSTLALDAQGRTDRTSEISGLEGAPGSIPETRTSGPYRPTATPGNAKDSPDARRIIYSNANVNENYPDPVTPYLFSVAERSYYHYFRNLGLALGIDPARLEAMETPLQSLVALHGGRLYYNLTNIHLVLKMAPAGDFLASAFDQFTGTSGETRSNEELSRFSGQRRFGGRTAELTRIAWRTARIIATLPGQVSQFETIIDAFAQKTNLDHLTAASASELRDQLREFLNIRFHRWLPASLADASSMVSYGLLKRVLRREFPEADQASLHNSLLIGLRNVVSAEPAVCLWRLSRTIRGDARLQTLFCDESTEAILEHWKTGRLGSPFSAAFEQYLEEWGFRRSGELLLTRPSYQEDPGALIEVLRAYALQGDSPDANRFAEQTQARESDTRRVLQQLRHRGKGLGRYRGVAKAWFVGWLLRWTQQAIALRERARHRQALLYTRLRSLLLAAGDRCVDRGAFAHREDVLYLRFQELDELLSDQADLDWVRQTVALRRIEYEASFPLTPPETLSLPPGASWRAAPNVPEEHVPGTSPDRLVGTAACAGRAVGRAAVLRDISEFSRLEAGDVLVAAQTDPGWGPVFLLIRGLIIERGGMLSHGAILAREYGIPTVVGVQGATQAIRHGQLVVVQGDLGIVELRSDDR